MATARGVGGCSDSWKVGAVAGGCSVPVKGIGRVAGGGGTSSGTCARRRACAHCTVPRPRMPPRLFWVTAAAAHVVKPTTAVYFSVDNIINFARSKKTCRVVRIAAVQRRRG